jgi:hypothetical protein
MSTGSLPLVEFPYQGPIALERALFCIECEVIFTDLARCPRCCSEVVWPLAGWLSPAQPDLLETPALMAAAGVHNSTEPAEAMLVSP